jgi:hypothetical protein
MFVCMWNVSIMVLYLFIHTGKINQRHYCRLPFAWGHWWGPSLWGYVLKKIMTIFRQFHRVLSHIHLLHCREKRMRNTVIKIWPVPLQVLLNRSQLKLDPFDEDRGLTMDSVRMVQRKTVIVSGMIKSVSCGFIFYLDVLIFIAMYINS